MSARDGLTRLFRTPEPVEPFRQGEVLSFNGSTGANTVRVGGATLVNLPFLLGSTFAPGDAVILLKYRSSWAILGQIVLPA